MLSMSILITSEDGGEPRSLPPAIRRNIASLKRAHPDLEHRLFFLPELSRLIRGEFGAEVHAAFETLAPYAYKADLARYCLLHRFGGVYADLSYFLAAPLPLEPGRITVFRDFLWSAPWDTSNALIGAPAGHKAFEVAIERVCANVRNRYYGSTSLCPTGPALFGRALAIACAPEELICGEAKNLEKGMIERMVRGLPLPPDPRIHCLTLQKKLLALKLRNAGAAGLASLGVAGGNSYAAMWEGRQVYGQP